MINGVGEMTTILMKLWMSLMGVRYRRGFKCRGLFLILKRGNGEITFGEGCMVNSSPFSNLLGLFQRSIIIARRNGKIQIGNHVGISGVTIHGSNIVIGDYTAIGANSKIIDHDFHSLNYLERRTDAQEHAISRPVLIGSDVFIGCNSLILKGTVIGDRSIVGAGAVVSGVFPPDCVIAGNPARIIKYINQGRDGSEA